MVAKEENSRGRIGDGVCSLDCRRTAASLGFGDGLVVSRHQGRKRGGKISKKVGV